MGEEVVDGSVWASNRNQTIFHIICAGLGVVPSGELATTVRGNGKLRPWRARRPDSTLCEKGDGRKVHGGKEGPEGEGQDFAQRQFLREREDCMTDEE